MSSPPDRLKEAAYLIRFSVVGACGFVVDLSVFFGLRELGLDRGPSSAIAIWLAMSSNYCWNRLWTFSDRSRQAFWRQYIAFCLSCLLGAVVNWSTRVLLWWLFPAFFGSYELVAIAAGVGMGMGSNFLLCRLLVFRGVDGERRPEQPEPLESLNSPAVVPLHRFTFESDIEPALTASRSPGPHRRNCRTELMAKAARRQ